MGPPGWRRRILRTLLDPDYLRRLRQRNGDQFVERFADLAFPTGDAQVHRLVEEAWSLALGSQTDEENQRRVDPAQRVARVAGTGSPREHFVRLFDKAIDSSTQPELAARCLECLRAPIAARIQLEILAEDLERVAVTAAEDVEQGGSKGASSVYWSSEFFERNGGLQRGQLRTLTPTERVTLFRQLRIGEEQVTPEADSRLTIGVLAQLTGVAGAMIAGDRGGLPLPIRTTLASVRGITLPLSGVVRLTAREPWVGAALAAVLTGLVLWIALSKNALLGALFPAIALIVVALLLVLFTIATNLFEQPLGGGRRWFAFALLAGIPLALGILGGWPAIHAVRDWLDDHLSAGATRVAAVLGFTAAGLALLRLAFSVKRSDQEDDRRRKGARRRKILSCYRPVVLAALFTLAGGFIAHRWLDQTNNKHQSWSAVADEHKGTILVAILLGVLFAAALAAEVVVPALQSLRTRKSIADATPKSNQTQD